MKGQKYNEKVDIWSIGVIAFILLTGNDPYYTNHPNKKYKLKALIAAKDPDFSKNYFLKLSKPC